MIETGQAGGMSSKRCLFLLTVRSPGSRLSGERVWEQAEHPDFGMLGLLPIVLEMPKDTFICIPGRTHNRIRSPRLTASGQ